MRALQNILIWGKTWRKYRKFFISVDAITRGAPFGASLVILHILVKTATLAMVIILFRYNNRVKRYVTQSISLVAIYCFLI